MENKEILLTQFDPRIDAIDSQSVMVKTFRLDGQYYVLFKNGIGELDADSFISFNECCTELYEVPPFKHIYVKQGVPFYTSSSLFETEFIPSHYLTPEMPNIDRYRIKKGQILMARSGNVESGILGQILVVGDILDNTTTSDHVLRFTPNKAIINPGYLAAFLMSEFCKGQLLKNAAGAVIPAIRPDSLRDLQIPLIDTNIQSNIGSKILSAVDKREQSIRLLQNARSLVLKYNNLKPICKIHFESIDIDDVIQISLTNLSEFTEDYRLDAHFYNPEAKIAVESIVAHSSRFEKLYEIADCLFKGSRSTRNYVEKEHGVPFLSGKNIVQMRPDYYYVSKSETDNLSEMILEKNQVLISRSGTLGRTAFVWNNYENFAASEHLIRIVPNTKLVDAGYLFAFLSSDYGYYQLLRYKHGAVIDEITEDQISQSLIPLPALNQQKQIGDLVRQAYDLRAEAIHLEDEAQDLLTKALSDN